MQKIKIEQRRFVGTFWFGAWLFTIGSLHLTFWKGVALVFGRTFLDATFSSLLRS